jgi:hypothetical protein
MGLPIVLAIAVCAALFQQVALWLLGIAKKLIIFVYKQLKTRLERMLHTPITLIRQMWSSLLGEDVTLCRRPSTVDLKDVARWAYEIPLPDTDTVSSEINNIGSSIQQPQTVSPPFFIESSNHPISQIRNVAFKILEETDHELIQRCYNVFVKITGQKLDNCLLRVGVCEDGSTHSILSVWNDAEGFLFLNLLDGGDYMGNDRDKVRYF